jgi:hypothetical protein
MYYELAVADTDASLSASRTRDKDWRSPEMLSTCVLGGSVSNDAKDWFNRTTSSAYALVGVTALSASSIALESRTLSN